MEERKKTKKGNIGKRRDYKMMRMKKQKNILRKEKSEGKIKGKKAHGNKERGRKGGEELQRKEGAHTSKKTFLSLVTFFFVFFLLSNLIVRFCLMAYVY